MRISEVHKRLRRSDFEEAGDKVRRRKAIIPTNEQAPNYSVTVVGVSFVHNFQ